MMKYASIVLLMGVLALAAVGAAKPTPPAAEPPLEFAQDGEDLVVSMPLRVNNSEHVVLTHSWVNPTTKEVSLFYFVAQNKDLLVRSQKDIEIQWRIADHKRGDETYRVNGTTAALPSNELKALGSKIQTMAKKGKQVRPQAEKR